mgnify:CR=1 FL=1
MNKLMRLSPLLCVLFLVACSTSVRGPMSGKKYEVNVGCTDDMKRYEKQREEAIDGKPEQSPPPLPPECVPVEESRDLQRTY